MSTVELSSSSPQINTKPLVVTEENPFQEEKMKVADYSSFFFTYVIPLTLVPISATVFIFSLVTTGELEVLYLLFGGVSALMAYMIGKCLHREVTVQ